MQARIRRVTVPGLLAAGLMVAGAAQARPSTNFIEHDGNRDGAVSRIEFEQLQGDPRVFMEADINRDGMLNQDEFLKAESIDLRSNAGRHVSDGWITTKVKSLLLRDNFRKGMGIEVETRGGIVHLSGAVDDPEVANRAVRIASGVQGVKGLRNGLELKR